MRYVCKQVDDSIEMHASCWFLAPDTHTQVFSQFYGVCYIQTNTLVAFLYNSNGQFSAADFFFEFTWSTLFVKILFSEDFRVHEND